MAYRKQWYTFGIRSAASIEYDLPVSALNNGDTVFNIDTDKPEYIYVPPYANEPTSRIWMNEDCVYVDDITRASEVGNIVQLHLDLQSGGANPTTWVQKCGTGTPRYYGQFLGVVYRVPIGSDSLNPAYGRAVAIQGIYNVKFTVLTNGVTAGNLAVISSVAGEASQTGSTASLGVIGVIMETKTFNETDRLAKVMIQSFSSK